LENIEKSVIIFFEIFFISCGIEIAFDKSAKRSSSSHTEFVGTGIEKSDDQLIGQ
jgi:hypothetical protein